MQFCFFQNFSEILYQSGRSASGSFVFPFSLFFLLWFWILVSGTSLLDASSTVVECGGSGRYRLQNVNEGHARNRRNRGTSRKVGVMASACISNRVVSRGEMAVQRQELDQSHKDQIVQVNGICGERICGMLAKHNRLEAKRRGVVATDRAKNQMLESPAMYCTEATKVRP